MNFPKIQIQAARVNANLTQKEAAKKLNISQATLQNYESGKIVSQYPTDYIFLESITLLA